LKKGFSNLIFIAFLVTFIAIFVFLGAQWIYKPSAIAGQATLKYNYTSDTYYLVNQQDTQTVSINNIPNMGNVSSLTCGFGVFGLDGIAGCVINYANAFIGFTKMSSDNTFLVILLGILTLLLAYAIAMLFGGS
jgi:hypothetical protein